MDTPAAAGKVASHAKGLTKQKPIVYAIMAVAVIGIAYYMRTRPKAADPLPTAAATNTDNPTLDDSTGAYYGDTTTYDPGAYYGTDSPYDPGTNSPSATGNTMSYDLSSFEVIQPSVPDTGGGAPDTSIQVHDLPAPADPPVPVSPDPIQTVAPAVSAWSVPVVTAIKPQPQAATDNTLASPYGSRYPYHSLRGWYRLVTPPDGSRWHYYGPSDSPKIKVK